MTPEAEEARRGLTADCGCGLRGECPHASRRVAMCAVLEAAIRAEERERCAQIADRFGEAYMGEAWALTMDIAAAIREVQ